MTDYCYEANELVFYDGKKDIRISLDDDQTNIIDIFNVSGGSKKSNRVKKVGGSGNKVFPIRINPFKLSNTNTSESTETTINALPKELIEKIASSLNFTDLKNFKGFFPDLETIEGNNTVQSGKLEDLTTCKDTDGITDHYFVYKHISADETEIHILDRIKQLKNDKIFLWIMIHDLLALKQTNKNVFAVFFLNGNLSLKFVCFKEELHISLTNINRRLGDNFVFNFAEKTTLNYNENCSELNRLIYCIFSSINHFRIPMKHIFLNAKLVIYPTGIFNRLIKKSFYKLIKTNNNTKCTINQLGDEELENEFIIKIKKENVGKGDTNNPVFDNTMYDITFAENKNIKNDLKQLQIKLNPTFSQTVIINHDETSITRVSEYIILVNFERTLYSVDNKNKVNKVPLMNFVSIASKNNPMHSFRNFVNEMLSNIKDYNGQDNILAIANKVENIVAATLQDTKSYKKIFTNLYINYKNNTSIKMSPSDFEELSEEIDELLRNSPEYLPHVLENNIKEYEEGLKELLKELLEEGLKEDGIEENIIEKQIEFYLSRSKADWEKAYNELSDDNKNDTLAKKIDEFKKKYEVFLKNNDDNVHTFYFEYDDKVYKFKQEFLYRFSIVGKLDVISVNETLNLVDGGGRKVKKNKVKKTNNKPTTSNKNGNKIQKTDKKKMSTIPIKKFVLGRDRLIHKDSSNNNKQYITYKGEKTFLSDARILEKKIKNSGKK